MKGLAGAPGAPGGPLRSERRGTLGTRASKRLRERLREPPASALPSKQVCETSQKVLEAEERPGPAEANSEPKREELPPGWKRLFPWLIMAETEDVT